MLTDIYNSGKVVWPRCGWIIGRAGEPPSPHQLPGQWRCGYCALAKWLSYKYHHSDNTTLNTTTWMTQNQGQQEKTNQRKLSKICKNCQVMYFQFYYYCTLYLRTVSLSTTTQNHNIQYHYVTVSQYKAISGDKYLCLISSLDCELWFYYGVSTSSQHQHQPNVWRVQISSRGIFSHSAHLSRLSALQIIIFSKHDSGSTQQGH